MNAKFVILLMIQNQSKHVRRLKSYTKLLYTTKVEETITTDIDWVIKIGIDYGPSAGFLL